MISIQIGIADFLSQIDNWDARTAG